MSDFHVELGDSVTFEKTVSESDVYMFAGITGDFAPNHVNEEFMKKSAYGRRIAHGALLIGYMSTASSMIVEKFAKPNSDETPVSLGYDRIRFVGPVFIGDTIKVSYKIARIEPDKRRSYGEIKVTKQDGTTVAAGEHILKWVSNI